MEFKMPGFPGIWGNLGILDGDASGRGANRMSGKASRRQVSVLRKTWRLGGAARRVGSWRSGLPGAPLRVARSCGVLRSAQDDGVFWRGAGGHGVRPYGMRRV